MSKVITNMIGADWKESFIEGFGQGFRNGRRQAMISSIEKLQKKLGLSLQEACDVEEISVENYKNMEALKRPEELKKEISTLCVKR